jgi:thiamine biosynthesis lipoprotein
VLFAPERACADAAAAAAFERLRELDRRLSDYDPESELSRLGARSDDGAPTPPVPLSDDLFGVLAAAQELAQASGGAFDATVGPLVRLWRRARRQHALPAAARIEAAAHAVGYGKLELDAAQRTARLLAPGMRLDLGGIAKGYILGQALAILRSNGAPAALIEAGGDIVLGDPPPGRPGWDIGLVGMVPGPLANLAVATSGSSEQFVEIAGIRYGHIVDPRTGLGVSTGFQATVLGPDPAVADALATALVILGPTAQEALLTSFPGYRAAVVAPGLPEVTAAATSPQFRPGT